MAMGGRLRELGIHALSRDVGVLPFRVGVLAFFCSLFFAFHFSFGLLDCLSAEGTVIWRRFRRG